MIYELFLEGQLVDIRQDLGMQLSYNIDDVNKYGSRDTSFSKTIVLPGTAKNNKILGFVGELGSNNPYLPGNENIGVNFNVAQTTKAELRANGLLLLKGVFRLTGIVKDRDMIEYEGNLFGELGGFIAAIGADKLEDLNFSEYNHTYTRDNIVNSWDGKTIINVSAGFADFSGLKFIVIESTFDYNFKIGSQIIVTDAVILSNNKTYTVVSYFIDTINSISYIGVAESVTFSGADNINIEFTRDAGTGYYYPLIDYGTYSTPEKNPGRVKRDYDYRTFRPALFVKEYIDKIFLPTGYTYESSFFDSDFFKKLIVPGNTKELIKIATNVLTATRNTSGTIYTGLNFNSFNFDSKIGNNFTMSGGGQVFTYIGTENISVNGILLINGLLKSFFTNTEWYISIFKNNSLVITQNYPPPNVDTNIKLDINFSTSLSQNDTISVIIGVIDEQCDPFTCYNTLYLENILSTLTLDSTNPVAIPVFLNDNIEIKYSIPRNILQKDFFVWIMKMFNLYITEDKVKEKHLLIEPYVDYYDLSESKDWTYKVARDKAWNIKPMGMLNGRFFEYKYKDDNDFYNEGYKKKYNIPYGSRLEDTSFQFAKDKQTIEIGFSPSVLIQYDGTDKVVTAIYKKSSGNAVDQEERMDSNIRIMMAKKMTGVASWFIRNNDATPASANLGAALTAYGYAGHFDDPVNPTKDINFGAASEIYFNTLTYPSTNLFNDYWSGYIAEIADKDSKLLTCYVYLTDLDIAQLDFSKPVFIDGVLWRINKVMDFDATSGELTKVELLKVINNG
jgi:hypothetical protein